MRENYFLYAPIPPPFCSSFLILLTFLVLWKVLLYSFQYDLITLKDIVSDMTTSHLKALMPLKWTETFVNVSTMKLHTLMPLVEIYLKSILMKLSSLGNKEQNLYLVWVCTGYYLGAAKHSSITIKIKATKIYFSCYIKTDNSECQISSFPSLVWIWIIGYKNTFSKMNQDKRQWIWTDS